MTTKQSDPDLERVLADMRQEFIENSEGRLEDVEAAISRLLAGSGKPDHDTQEIKRHIHSLKGGGGSFGYPAVTIWSHALEDYMETITDMGVDQLSDIRLFVDRIRQVLETGINPDDSEIAAAVKNMPLRGPGRRRGSMKGGVR